MLEAYKRLKFMFLLPDEYGTAKVIKYLLFYPDVVCVGAD
jgi:hypothetical protein